MSTNIPKLSTGLTLGGSAGGDCVWVTTENGTRTKVCGLYNPVVDTVPDGGDGQMPPGLARILQNLKGRFAHARGEVRSTYAGTLISERHGERHKVHIVQSVDAKGQVHIDAITEGAKGGDLHTSSAIEDGTLTVRLKATTHR